MCVYGGWQGTTRTNCDGGVPPASWWRGRVSKGDGRVLPELTVVVVCHLPHGGEGVCLGGMAG